MNIHKSQLFWWFTMVQMFKTLGHPFILVVLSDLTLNAVHKMQFDKWHTRYQIHSKWPNRWGRHIQQKNHQETLFGVFSNLYSFVLWGRKIIKKNVAKSSTRVLTQIISLVVHWVMAIPMLDKGCLAVNHGVSSMAGNPPESTGGFTG